MAITVQEIVDRCNSALDSEGSDRYLWERDFQPALSYANEWIVSLFNSVFSAKKLSEEVLKDLIRIRVFQASSYSRIAFDSTIIGDSLWSILAVYPSITTIPTSPTIPTATSESVYRTDVSLSGTSGKSAKRLSFEEWAEKDRSFFIPGNTHNSTNSELIEYAYVNFADYTGGGGYTLVNDNFEIEIAPSVAGQLVGMVYLKYPVAPTLITQSIEFPESLTAFIVNAVLNFISFKQGDATNLYGTTERGKNELISLLT